MWQPARRKFNKSQKLRVKGVASKRKTLCYGTWGLKVLENVKLTNKQIEAARVAVVRYIQKSGKLWIRVFPDIPVSKKPLEVRMGKGKGSVEYWVALTKRGTIVMEIDGVEEKDAIEALKRAADKLPVKTKIVKKTGIFA